MRAVGTRLLMAGALALAAAGVSCGGGDTCTPGGDGTYLTRPYPTLDGYCVVSMQDATIVPKAGVVPYDESTPLFSDYASKFRTVWIPPGKSATYTADGPMDFPVGTIVTKSFGFPADVRNPQPVTWVETRVMVRRESGWFGVAYVWDKDQKKATIQPGGSLHEISFVKPSGAPATSDYLVPSQNECIKCHEDLGTIVPIGLRAARINHDYPYPGGTENQLDHWARLGILQGAPASDQAPRLVAWDDTSQPVEARARAYLEANCSHCHSETGEARTTGLFLGNAVTDPYKYGVCKNPVATGQASSDLTYDVVPGQPDRSILVFRVQSTQPSIAMPEIGRSVVHDEGVALLRDWITGLPGQCQ